MHNCHGVLNWQQTIPMKKQTTHNLAAAIISGAILASCSTTSTLAPTAKAPVKPSVDMAAKNAALVKRGLPELPSQKTVAKAAALPKDRHGMPTYGHKVRTRLVRTTAYSHMEREPGAPGRKNASGGTLKYGKVRSAAADWSVYPLGTKFRVKGQPHIYVVDDYGSALVNTNTVDIFKPNLRLMNKWGTRKTEITVVQWGDWERSAKLLKHRTKYWHCRDMYVNLMKKFETGQYAQREVEPVTKPL